MLFVQHKKNANHQKGMQDDKTIKFFIAKFTVFPVFRSFFHFLISSADQSSAVCPEIPVIFPRDPFKFN